jgi:arsenical pump membrane protein
VPDWIALVLALIALGAALGAAVFRPRRMPEAAAAGIGALVLLAAGVIGAGAAGHAVRTIAPTVGFLAALLLLAEGCRREGLFESVGALMASRSGGDERRLLALVFTAASATTIVLGLDATVVLLTPVVVLTAARLRTDIRAPAYACAHLANSASLLLPVSNLTNLLAFRASGLSFAHFAGLMALPTAAVVGVEWAALAPWAPRGHAQVAGGGTPAGAAAPPALREAERLPRYPLLVVGLTLAGFAASSVVSLDPVWVAVAGAVAITLPALVRGDAAPSALWRSVAPGFLVFVLGLSVIVAAAGNHGLTSAVHAVLPAGSSLGDLLLITLVAAVLANLVNNLPATLILVPVAAGLGSAPVLAVLIGVNVGPNLTEVGSLATLLWRRVLRAEGVELPLWEFARLGLLTVPPALLVATVLLWLSGRVL